MGGNITQEMIRRRAEHNEGILYTLEELVLQEEGIERIDATLGTLCQHLKILYMPNNLIPRLQNLHRLKELQYLNLAMNNILKVEGLEKCEALEKLDLTLNFVDLPNLPSVMALNANVHLKDLFLTGNPCSDWDGCRSYVIAKLPHLKRLDAWEIKPRERITALQEIHHLEEDLHKLISASANSAAKEPQVTKTESGALRREYTPATRLAEHHELQELREQEAKKSSLPDRQQQPSKRRKGFDPLPTEGRIYQKNEGGWEFKLVEGDCGTKMILDVAAGKYLDTSLIDVDVQPLLVRVLIKGKLLQLRLPSEVKTDASTAERSKTSGHLLVTMPLATANVRAQPKTYPSYSVTAQFKRKPPSSHLEAVDIHKIVNDDAASTGPNPPIGPSTSSIVAAPLDPVREPSCTAMDICSDDVPPLE